MKKLEIILVGGGGHCKSCIDVIEAEGLYKIKGIIDLPNRLGDSILEYPVIGNDDDLPKLAKRNNNFLITMGHLGNSSRRRELFDIIKNNGGNFPIIVSSLARVSKYAQIASGTIVMHFCLVNSNSKIDENSIINNSALVEHDVTIGKDCHISTNVKINGNCKISDNVFIGSSSTLKNGVHVTDNTIIGLGSMVVKSISKSGIYYGLPLRKKD